MGYATDGMAVSQDGNLFIVACGSDYEGNMDLFYSVKQFGSWSFPEVLGVSTRGDERSVYISADNKTIYFSSDGHGGFGGLDILKTTFEGRKTGPIVNIGKPFNTSKDDMGFVISGEGEAAFFIRDLDIYYADLSQLNDQIKPSSSSLIFGTISLNNSPVESTVVVKSEGEILGKTQSDSKGKYALTLPKLFSETEVFIEDDSTELFESHSIQPKIDLRYVEYEVNFVAEQKPEIENPKKLIVEEIQEIEVKSEAVIYFDFDQHDIKPSEEDKLKELLSSVAEGSVVFIDGHTDHYGSNGYNDKLSEKRADAIMDWFIQNTGVSANHINKTFKGEAKTLNSGYTNEERALNRRVTVRIENY
jgi:outer membrane protein OmpA-like peptidoglycan-associated protein